MKKLEVEILKNCSGSEMSFTVGEKHVLSEEFGTDLIKAGYATLLEEIEESVVEEPIQEPIVEPTEEKDSKAKKDK